MKFAPSTLLLWVSTAVAANPRLLTQADDPCAHQNDFSQIINSDSTKAKDFWNSVNATGILTDYLNSQPSTKNWAKGFLGENYDCASFPGSSNCGYPSASSCQTYKPKAKFYVQFAISNLYDGLQRWHEALQDAVLKGLTSDIENIVQDWGNPDPESDQFLNFILGSIISGAGFVAPGIGEPIKKTAEIFKGVMEATKAATPKDIGSDLRIALGIVFTNLQDQLKNAVARIYEGSLPQKKCDPTSDICGSIIIGLVIPKASMISGITDIFADGTFLENDIVRKSIDSWIDNATQLIKEGLLVSAWKAAKDHTYPRIALKVDKDISEGECKKHPGTVWNSDGCSGFAKFLWFDIELGTTYVYWEQAEFDKARKVLRNVDAALANAIACDKAGGGEPKFPTPDFSTPSSDYPPCFFNIARGTL